MPSGIILASSSQGATPEAIADAFEKNGFERPELPTEKTEPVELKREDFDSDEAFEQAQAELEAKAEEAEEQEEIERQKKQEEKHPKLSRRQRAVAQATKQLQDELKAAKDRIAALEGKTSEAKEEPKAPRREDFKTDEEFEEARFQYRYKLERAKEQTTEAQKAMEEHQKSMLANYVAAKDEIKEEYSDWDEVLEEFGNSPVSQSVYMTILGLEEGPRVSYYLAKHPDYLEKVNAMFPDAAMREVIRLHDRLKAGSGARENSKPKTRAKLPEPIAPVSTSATSSTLTAREAALKRDFRAFKAAQRAGR